MDNLSNEVYYKILNFLDLVDIYQLNLTNKTLNVKNKKYVVELVFVNHSLERNIFFKLEMEYLLLNINKICNILKYIINNDFVNLEFNETVFINIVSGIDITGYAVFEYYLSYLKGIDYYVFPELDMDFVRSNTLHIKNQFWEPKYTIYYEEELRLKNMIQSYIQPNKSYKNIIYFNEFQDLIHSSLI